MSSTIQRLGVAATAAILGLIVVAPAAQAATQDTKAATTAVAVTAPAHPRPGVGNQDSQIAGYTVERAVPIKSVRKVYNVSKTSCTNASRDRGEWHGVASFSAQAGWEGWCDRNKKVHYNAYHRTVGDGLGTFFKLSIKPGDVLDIEMKQASKAHLLYFKVTNLTTKITERFQQANLDGLSAGVQFGTFTENIDGWPSPPQVVIPFNKIVAAGTWVNGVPVKTGVKTSSRCNTTNLTQKGAYITSQCK